VPLFDPVAGMRAMADIQSEGLRAASELLERMLQPDRDRPSAGSGSRPSDAGYTALVDAWAQLLQRVAAGLAQPGASGAVTVPVDSSSGGPPVRLVLERSAQPPRTTAEIWLHNGTSGDVGPLVLGCGALTAADGGVLDAGVRFDPAEVTLLPPRSSRGVVVSVVAHGQSRPGIYRGTIQADGAPKLWLPVEVAVEPC
jgi:hypothetical protein